MNFEALSYGFGDISCVVLRFRSRKVRTYGAVIAVLVLRDMRLRSCG